MNNKEFVQEALRLCEGYPTQYRLGTFFNKRTSEGKWLCDCTGLIKAILWEYPESGIYKRDEIPDQNDAMMLADSTESGPINSIPEIPGLIVWQSGHAGIYLGNGQVLESTAKVWTNGKGNGLVISQFNDSKAEMYRGTWQKWFKHRYVNYEEVNDLNLKEGRNDFQYLGKKIIVYKQKRDQRLGMISASGSVMHRALQTIDKIDDERIHYCKVNCNYFDMSNCQHYGVEITPQVELVPRQKEYITVYQDRDTKKIEYCNSADFWRSSASVEFACTPFAVLVHDGKDISVRSSAFTNKLGKANTQTFLLQFKDMSTALCVCTGGLTPEQCRSFAKQFPGLIHLSFYDSGGSTQMIINGTKILYTGRQIANVLTLYAGSDTSEPEQEKGNEDMLKTIHVDLIGLYIRDKIRGNVIGFITKEDSMTFTKVEPVAKRQADGYQWFKVTGKWEYKGKTYTEGYCQYDSSCYWVE